MSRSYLHLFQILCACLIAGQVIALPTPVPSAGIIERELEREYEAEPLDPIRKIPSIEIDIPKEQLDLPEGVKVRIDCFILEGNNAISTKEITDWIRGECGKDFCLQDIYELCGAIERGYEKNGYFLARAYPPPQKIKDNTIVIRIMEGDLGKLEIIGKLKYYSRKFIFKYFQNQIGEAIQYDRLMRSLFLLNEFMDLQVGLVLRKGEKVGTADVLIEVREENPMNLYLNLNNYGKDLTTNYRVGGRFDVGNVIVEGSKLSIAQVVGFPVDALYFTNVFYEAPLNAKGTFLDVAYLFSKFHVFELRELNLKGRSDIGTLKLSHALVRKRAYSLDLFGYFDYNQIQNFVLATKVSFDKLRVVTAGMKIDGTDPLVARNIFDFRTTVGIPNFLGGLKAVDIRASRIGAGGRFVKCNVNYDRLQPFLTDSFFMYQFSGQYGFYKLTLPEQFYLGGVGIVRGFPLATALGDSGYVMNGDCGLSSSIFGRLSHFPIQNQRAHPVGGLFGPWRSLSSWGRRSIPYGSRFGIESEDQIQDRSYF